MFEFGNALASSKALGVGIVFYDDCMGHQSLHWNVYERNTSDLDIC